MEQIKWGVLGTANIARKELLPAMLEVDNCELYAIAGRNAEKVTQFVEEFGFQVGYNTYEEMLDNEELDAIYIPLPNSMHCEWVKKFARAGKHILCEKPMGLTETEVLEMVEVCRENDVILMEAFAYLHSSAIKEVKAKLESGIIGEVNFIESNFLTERPKDENVRMKRALAGGGIYDLGCYCTSFILTMFGEDEPDVVSGTAHFTEGNIDDLLTGYMWYNDGRRAILSCGMCSAQRFDTLNIYGTAGKIQVNVPFNSCGELSYVVSNDKGDETFIVETENNYIEEIIQMNKCIENGEEAYVSNEFSLKNARVLDKLLNTCGYNKK